MSNYDDEPWFKPQPEPKWWEKIIVLFTVFFSTIFFQRKP